MKKITILTVMLLVTYFGNSQTVLTAGDIAFVGTNTDGASNADDQVAFLLLKDIDALTSIIFTDRGWNDIGGFSSNAGDGEFTWTSGIALTAGQVVTIDMGPLAPAAYSSIGDQLFAIQGSIASPIFIAGLQFNEEVGSDDTNWDGAATSNSTSALPNALVNGDTAIRLVPEADNWQFSCALAGGSPVTGNASAIRAIVHDRANWAGNSTTVFNPALEAGCAFTLSVGGDTTPPVITCAPTPSPITAGINGMASIPDLVSGTTATDDVSLPGDITITQSPTAGTMVGVGVHLVLLTAMDEAGNTDSCTINVTVNEPPSTTLLPGDIAFVGFNLDGGDSFAFILLKDIIAGTNIKLTDCGVSNPNTITCAGPGGEGSATWYAPVAMSRGDVITLPGSFITGAILSNIGEQIFAYQGTAAAPLFIAAIHSNIEVGTNDADWDLVNTSNDDSALPDQLINGVNAIRLYSAGAPETEVDNWQFDCNLVPGGFPITGSPAEIAAIINDIQYWISSDTTEFSPTAQTGCTYNFDVPPVAVCTDFTAQLDASGTVTILPADVDGGSSDVEGPVTLTLDIDTFSCANVGSPVTVTLTVTDSIGQTDTCTATVTVEDNIVPVANCTAPFIVQLDADGNASITAADINNGSSDACGFATTIDIDTFDCSNIGPNTVTLTVTDVNGNVSTCTTVVTIEDNVAPIANCAAPFTIQLDANGNVGITVADIDNGSTDACGIASTTIDIDTFDCSNIGPNTVTLTVTDVNGNVSTCTTVVTVEDNIVPVITCPANIIISNDSGVCGAMVNYDNDLVIPVSVSSSMTTLFGTSFANTINGMGLNTFPSLVSNHAGTSSTNSWVGQGTNGTIDFDLGGSFPISGMSFWNQNGGGPGSAGSTGIQNVQILYSTDGVVFNPIPGTPTSFSQVTGNNALAPEQIFFASVTASFIRFDVQDNYGDVDTGFAEVAFTAGILFSDNCSGAVLTQTAGLPSGSTFPVGTTTNTFVATDASGNTTTCSFDVTINDTEAPVITCPSDIIQSNDAGVCGAVVNYTVSTSDNCPGATPVQTAGLPSGSTFPVGTTTNTFVVTDASGNMVSCSFDVTINDTENPVLTCPANIVQSNDAGICGAVVNYTVPIASDNCTWAPIIQTAGLPSGSTFPVGSTTNTFVVTDASGNTATCSFDVTINDTEAPVIICPADIIQSNDAGVCGAVVNYIAPTGTDNCPGQTTTQTAGLPSGSTFPVGTTTNTFVVTDASGNTATCSFDVTINDMEVPVITCPADITQSNDPGICGAVVNYTAPTGADNCSGQTTIQTAGLPSGSTFPVGTTTNTFVVTDASGNTATCSFDVTINDTEAPVITCPADITQSNDPGICGAVVNYTAPTGTDNCSGQTTTQTAGLPSGSTFPVGTTTNTFVVTDASGNTATCSFDVTINDTETPVITCPVDIIQSNDAGLCGAVVNYTAPTGTDNCPGQTTTQTAGLPSGSTFPVGTTTNTFVVTDASGNTATCSFDVTINDTEAPVITCPVDIIQSNDAGVCGAVVNYTAPTGTDNCPGQTTTQTAGLPSGSTFPVGTTTNTFVVTDASGNTATCSFDVTINDTEAPVITCPADITQSNDPGICGAVVTYTVTTSDNCAGETLVQTAGLASGSEFPVGTTTNTFVVTDASGNTTTCSFDVTINDMEVPVITCPADITQSNDPGICGAVVNYTAPTGTDNCSGQTTTQTAGLPSGSTFPVGTTTNTFVVTDASGNTATCSFDVTINDTEVPVITCPADITQSNDPGICGAVVNYTAPTGADNCAGQTTTQTAGLPSGSTFPVGTTTNTFVVTDASGNTATCTFDVTINDTDAPVITCPADIIQSNDAGVCGAVVNYIPPTGTDNCPGQTTTQTAGLPSGSIFPVGTTTNTFVVTDASGNTSVCSFTITVIDNEPAVAVCQDITIQLDEFGNASIIAADVDGGSTDNCAVASTTIDIDTFDCSNVGPNNVTLTVTDVNGNVSTCIAVVTVEDVTAPVVACQNITVQLDANGTITIAANDIDNGSTDACGIASYELDMDTFDCSNIGENTVTLTVTDVNGNVSTCTAIVTVEDVTIPDLVCQDFTLELGANGTATLLPSDVIASLNDACGIFTTAVDITEFDCSDIGAPVTVQVFVSDVNGNLATCTAMVTVVDLLAPEITCPVDQTVDPGVGNLFYILPDYFATGEATATDNCTDPVTITTQDPAQGTTLPDGVYTITLTAEDEYGNVATCTFELEVESILGENDPSLSLGSVQLYPSPAKDVVTFGNPQLMELEKATIFDLTGRLVQTIDLEGMGATKTVNLQHLSAATYIVMIKGKTGQITKRLIKE